MNVIDEWLNSEGAKRDALNFKNGCYIISSRGCGKTAIMNDIFERLKEQKVSNIRYLRQKFNDVDATNAIKEFINKQYGANSFGRAVPDDSFDVLRYAWPTVEQIRKEFMMEFQKELYRGEVRAEYRYGRYYTYCGPDNIDAIFYVTNDGVKFRFEYNPLPGLDEAKEATTIFIPKEEFERKSWGEFMKDSRVRSDSPYEYIIKKVEEVSNFNLKIKHLNCGLVTHNFFMGAIRAYNAHLLNLTKTAKKPTHKELRGKFIKNDMCKDWIYCIANYWLHPKYDELNKRTKANLHAFEKPRNMSMETWRIIVKRYSKEYIKERYGVEETKLYYYEYDDGRIEIPCYEFVEDNDYPNKAKLITDRINPDTMDISKEMEMLKNYKKEEETNKMNINILKGAFNSKLYMMKNGSEDLSYLGTVMNMQIDRALGCELTGKIDFIADDEPVKKLQYFNREFIKNVVFNDPATIVEWKDGTKTVVQARDGEKFDPEKGLAMAISKKAMGNKRDYYHVFKHYLKKVTNESVFGENTKVVVVPAEIADDVMKYIADTFCEKEAEKSAKKKDLKEIVKSLPDELYYDNHAMDLKDFKVDSENDLVTFKCSKADAERIKGFITRSDDSNSVHITPETIEEVKRYEEDK